MKSITVEAKIENVDKVTEFVNEVLEEKECPLKVQMQLDVAIDEIFGNIAYYAYGKGSGNATIQIEMEDNPSKITLTFNGHSFSSSTSFTNSVTLSTFSIFASTVILFKFHSSFPIRYQGFCFHPAW